MDIKINFLEQSESMHHLAFIKALLIKCRIEELNIDYEQKVELKKQILKQLKSFEK